MKELTKHKVCAACHSLEIVDMNCVCTYEKDYDTIELEFESCTCCGNIDTYAADTEFNKTQILKYEDHIK